MHLAIRRPNDFNWTVSLIDTTGTFNPSLVVKPNGRLAVAYQTTTCGALTVAQQLTTGLPTGISSWSHELVDDHVAIVGNAPSLVALPDNRLAVSHYNSTDKDLLFAIQNGTTWTRYTIDSVGSVGLTSSLSRNGTGLAISYFDETNTNLKLAMASSTSPLSSANWTRDTADGSTSDAGRGSAACDLGTSLGVTYYDHTARQVKLLIVPRPVTGSPSSWQRSVIASTGAIATPPSYSPDNGNRTCLDLFQGRLAVGYYDPAIGLRLATSEAPLASTMVWTIQAVPGGQASGRAADLVSGSRSATDHSQRIRMSFYNGNFDVYATEMEGPLC